MNPVYTKIILVTIVFFILCLVSFYFLSFFRTYQLALKTDFPIVHNRCPDTWLEYDNKCIFSTGTIDLTNVSDANFKTFLQNNNKNLGNNNGKISNISTLQKSLGGNLYYKEDQKIADASVFKFGDYMTICDKRKWAKKNNIKWDGISNYTLC